MLCPWSFCCSAVECCRSAACIQTAKCVLQVEMKKGSDGQLSTVMAAFARPTRLVRSQPLDPSCQVNPQLFELQEEHQLLQAFQQVKSKVHSWHSCRGIPPLLLTCCPPAKVLWAGCRGAAASGQVAPVTPPGLQALGAACCHVASARLGRFCGLRIYTQARGNRIPA